MIISEVIRLIQVRYLESNVKVFVKTTTAALSLFAALLVVFSIAYAYSSVNVYNAILIVLIAAVCVCIVVSVLICFAIINTYNRKRGSGIRLTLTKWGLRVMLPVVLVLAKSNDNAKKCIRIFYIELNNIVVESDTKKYGAEDIMLLLPHCLQNSECKHKVTNNPGECRKCGKCKIGSLLDYTGQKNINLFIATGGTVARNIIKKTRPELIISVACERDLMSGIYDVRDIPVIGITNKQPNGPCFNTDVDIDAIKRKIEQLIN